MGFGLYTWGRVEMQSGHTLHKPATSSCPPASWSGENTGCKIRDMNLTCRKDDEKFFMYA